MNDLERFALLQSNDPTQSTISDYGVGRRSGQGPLMEDMGYVTPMSSRPGLTFASNATNALAMAALTRILTEAPGVLKATAAVPAYFSANLGVDAFRNYQQMTGDHRLQRRQSAWEMLMDAAARPTQQTPFNRGGGTY